MKEIYESVQQYILENPEYKILREEDKLWLDEVHTELGVRSNNNIIRIVTDLPCNTLLGRSGVPENYTIVDGIVWQNLGEVKEPTIESTYTWSSNATNQVTISFPRLDEVESKLKILEDWVESLSNKICASKSQSKAVMATSEYFNSLNR